MCRSLRYELMSRLCLVLVTSRRPPDAPGPLYCLFSFKCWPWLLPEGFNAVLSWKSVKPSLLSLIMIIMMVHLTLLFPAGGKRETTLLYIRVLSVSWWGCCQSCTKMDTLRWAWTYQVPSKQLLFCSSISKNCLLFADVDVLKFN